MRPSPPRNALIGRDAGWCLRANRAGSRLSIRRYFAAISRLGDGAFWYALMAALGRIEDVFGRLRSVRNAPRTLDLDLLRFGSLRSDKPKLTLPHPRMMSRAFVLLPLAEIAPEQVTPAELAAVQGQLIQRLGPLEPLTAAKD